MFFKSECKGIAFFAFPQDFDNLFCKKMSTFALSLTQINGYKDMHIIIYYTKDFFRGNWKNVIQHEKTGESMTKHDVGWGKWRENMRKMRGNG